MALFLNPDLVLNNNQESLSVNSCQLTIHYELDARFVELFEVIPEEYRAEFLRQINEFRSFIDDRFSQS